MTFDFDRMIRFYGGRAESSRKAHGDDHLTQLNQDRLDRLHELRNKPNLTPDELAFLVARQAVTEAFSRK